MSNELSPFLIRPNTLAEAMDLAKMISTSSFCPSTMKGKPGDVLLALQMGSEVGLSPMQSLQNIAVINGKPCLYGDGALGVVMSSKAYEYHKEWMEGDVKSETLKAFCLVKRKGSDEYIKTFSMQDAKKASLWSKPGVWQQYPERMLQMRARAFAIRDQFADALRGLGIREEIEDYHPLNKPSQPTKKEVTLIDLSTEVIPIASADPHLDEAIQNQFDIFMHELNTCLTIAQLQKVFDDIKAFNFKSNPELLKQLINKKDEIKLNIQQEQALLEAEKNN